MTDAAGCAAVRRCALAMHCSHAHVLAARPPLPTLQVVGQSADAVAVCKPHGMPVHVAGQYRKNTVHGILTAERPDLGPLYPVHRCACWGRCTAEALLGARALLA